MSRDIICEVVVVQSSLDASTQYVSFSPSIEEHSFEMGRQMVVKNGSYFIFQTNDND